MALPENKVSPFRSTSWQNAGGTGECGMDGNNKVNKWKS